MATIRELQARFSASAQGMRNTLKRVREDIRDVGKDTDKSMDQANKSLESLGKSSRQLEDIIKKSDNPKEFKKLQDAIQDAENDLRETGRVSERAMGQLRSATNLSTNALNDLGPEGRDSIRQVEKAVGQLEKDFGNLEKEIDDADKELDGFGDRMKNVVGGLISAGGVAGFVSSALDTSGLETTIEISMDIPEESMDFVKDTVRDVTAVIEDQEGALEGVRRQWALNADASDEANAEIVKGASVVARAYQEIDFTELIQEINEIGKELEVSDEEALALTNSLLKIGFPPGEIDIIAEYGQQLRNAGYDAEEIQAIMSAGVETGTWNIDNLLDGLKEGRIRLMEFGREVPDSVGELLEGLEISEEQLQEWGEAVSAGGEEGKEAFQEVAEALRDVEDDTARNLLGVELFGTMWEDQGENILDTITNMDDHLVGMEENQSALNEAIESMEEDPAVRLRDAMNDLKTASEPVLEVITDIILKLTDWVRENPQTIQSIGKVASVVGVLGAVLGTISPIVSTITGLLGLGGGGLGKTLLGLVGRAGPVGLAIGAFGTLAGGIYLASQRVDDNISKTRESFEVREEELNHLDDVIDKYGELQEKNQLTNDEILEYMDIMDQLENAGNEETIQGLTDRQAELLEKSGLTNAEMDEFLGLNDEIIEKVPEATGAISDQGNELAKQAEELAKINQEERVRMAGNLYVEITGQLQDFNNNLVRQQEIQEQIRQKEAERKQLQEDMVTRTSKLREIDGIILELQQQKHGADDKTIGHLDRQISQYRTERDIISEQLGLDEERIGRLDSQIGKQEEKLGKVNSEIDNYYEMIDQYIRMELLNAGITDEKGEQYASIQDAERGIERQIQKLKEQHRAGEITTEEYRQQIRELEGQQTKLGILQGEAGQLNDILSESIDKNVNLKENPTIREFNRLMGTEVSKTVKLTPLLSRVRGMQNAEGTRSWRGGLTVVGDGRGANAGAELYRTPDGSYGLTPATDTLMNLPRGTRIWSARETKRMVRNALDGSKTLLQNFANGGVVGSSIDWVTSGGWAESVIRQSPSRMQRGYDIWNPMEERHGTDRSNREMLHFLERIANAVESEKGVSIVMDGREVARGSYRYTREMMEQDDINKLRARGIT